jgi:hypothetical protein
MGKNVQARINTLCASKRWNGGCLMHALRFLLHVHAMNLSTLGVHERGVAWLRWIFTLAHCVQFMTRSKHRRWHLEAYIVTILGAGGCLLWDLQKKNLTSWVTLSGKARCGYCFLTYKRRRKVLKQQMVRIAMEDSTRKVGLCTAQRVSSNYQYWVSHSGRASSVWRSEVEKAGRAQPVLMSTSTKPYTQPILIEPKYTTLRAQPILIKPKYTTLPTQPMKFWSFVVNLLETLQLKCFYLMFFVI